MIRGVDGYKDGIDLGLRCPLEFGKLELFVSCVDRRNSLFTSNDPEKILEFYASFSNMEELVEWMKERPRGVPLLKEIEGDEDITVVIPTMDYEGNFAKACRDEIFHGMRLIFVESTGDGDFYFNFAHYVNEGVKRALEYFPKWIVYSGDDMEKIDDVQKLKNGLSTINNKDYDVVFPSPSNYHTVPTYIGRRRLTYDIYKSLTSPTMEELYKKFGIDFFYAFPNMRSRAVFRRVSGTEFTNTTAFGIFGYDFIKSNGGILFDDTYINEHEDIDLSFNILLKKARTTSITYRIKALRGSSMVIGKPRELRQVAGRAYFNFKYSTLLGDRI